MITTKADSSETNRFLQQASEGDQQSWQILLERYRVRLLRMVELRMDRRIQSRFDPSDVIQEAYQEAWSRLPQYLAQPPAPFFLWLRYLTGQKLLELHRRHLGTRMRDARQEISLYRGGLPESSSAAMAAHLMDKEPRPSEDVAQAERKTRLEEGLNALSPLDREMLALRHFEQLSNAEAAQSLGLDPSTASKRYVRALKKLKEILAGMPGGLEEFSP
jgi:RNA polymerase sigma-70 factor (ECF subfamily)